MKDKKTFEYMGILFDSQEEIWFAQWCEELRLAGYLMSWHRETKSWEITPKVSYTYIKETQLKTKLKREEKEFVLLNGLTYTPDFSLTWSLKGWNRFGSTLTNPKKDAVFFAEDSLVETWIEIKPSFDQNNMTRDLSLIHI